MPFYVTELPQVTEQEPNDTPATANRVTVPCGDQRPHRQTPRPGPFRLQGDERQGGGRNCENDRKAIEAIGEVLVGSNRPFVVTSGTAIANSGDGQLATEDSPTSSWNPRAASEAAVKVLTSRGVNTTVVRLPQVHDTRKQGLVPFITAVAREKRVSAYTGDGSNRWPAAHVSDVARLYHLAFEKAEPGAIYHAVDEEGVSMKAIAEALGRGLKVPVISIKPEEAEAHFGWLGMFAGHDMPASSALTQKKLNWKPVGPGLIADLDGMDYTQA